MKNVDIENIVARAGHQRDQEVFREFYDASIDQMYHFVLYRTGDTEMAKEICQDAYLTLWRSLPRVEYRGDKHFFAFFWKIVRRQIAKAASRKKPHVSLDDLYELPAEEEVREDYRFLLQSLNLLKERQRLVIELRYFSHLRFSEIAVMLGISETHAKVIHYRAIRKLRNHLSHHEA